MTHTTAMQTWCPLSSASGCGVGAGGPRAALPCRSVREVGEGAGFVTPAGPRAGEQRGRTVEPTGPHGVAPALRQVTHAAGPPGSGAQAGKFGSR